MTRTRNIVRCAFQEGKRCNETYLREIRVNISNLRVEWLNAPLLNL